MMNRSQRRQMGMRGPAEENKQVKVFTSPGVTTVKLIGMTSRVESHVDLAPGTAFKLGWTLMKGAWKTYNINWRFWRKS